jgi:hypothetical protein
VDARQVTKVSATQNNAAKRELRMAATTSSFRPLTRDSTLRPWGRGIHVATGTAHVLGVPICNSAAVIELERPGELLVWNPIALTKALRESLRELEQTTGRRVTTLLAALDYTHAALRPWQQAFPEVKTFLVSERITDKEPGARGEVLDGERPVVPGAENALELLSVRGCLQPSFERSPKWRGGPRREWFALHKPSRSLLIGDMLQCNDRLSWIERRLFRLREGFAPNDVGFRVSDAREREAFLRDVLAWDFDQALTAHGKATASGADFIRQDLSDAFALSTSRHAAR